MDTCTIETGLLRKHPCGHPAVAHCLNCAQPLCAAHAVAEHAESGQKTGKFMCHECEVAVKEAAKNMAAVARTAEARKMAALDKSIRDQITAPPPAKKPPAAAPHAPAAPAEAHTEPEALEFTPKDGKLAYTTKKVEPGYKPD